MSKESIVFHKDILLLWCGIHRRQCTQRCQACCWAWPWHCSWGMLLQVVAIQCVVAELHRLWVLIIIPFLCVCLSLTKFSVRVDIDEDLTNQFECVGRLAEFPVRVAEKAFSYALFCALHGIHLLVGFLLGWDSVISVIFT